MPKRYAILINEDTLDLIQYLNGGVRPLITSDEDCYFTFQMTPGNTDTEDPDIQAEDDLYNEDGFLKDANLNLMIG
jgi:hypothetical protein